MANLGYATAIANLTGRIGQAKARGVIGSANAWIPAVQSIPRSLGDWAQARDDRKIQAQQAQLREFQLAEAQRESERRLAQWGDYREDRATAKQDKAKAAETKEQTEFKQQIYRFVITATNQPTDELKEAAWTRTRAAVAGASPKLASALPEHYDEAFARDLLNETMTDAQFDEAQKPKATEELLPVDVNGDPIYTPRSQAAGKKQYRAPVAPKEGPAPGSLEYEIVAEAAAKKIPVEALTAADRARVKARWDAAGRAPDKVGDEATRAQKATAERWRADQLNALEDRRRRAANGGFNQVTGEPNPVMSPREYQAAKERIESAYRESLGIAPPPPQMAAPLPGPPPTSVVPRPIPAPGPAPVASPGPPPAPPGPVAPPAVAMKVVTQAQIAAVAAKNGTTPQEERRRAIAEGFVVR